MIGGSGVSSRIDKNSLSDALAFLDMLRKPGVYQEMLGELSESIAKNQDIANRIGTADETQRLNQRAKKILEEAKTQAQELEHLTRTKLNEGERQLSAAWQKVKDRETELDRLIHEEHGKLDDRAEALDTQKASLDKWQATLLQMEKDLLQDKRHADDVRAVYESKCARLADAMR